MRVLAILGVFLFHSVHPFDATDWHIKNAQQSLVVTLIFIVFLYPWGMPMFFMLAGASSRFALLKRSARQYASERTTRLFIPFLVGSILLSPLQLYLEWMHKSQTGVFAGSLLDFFLSRKVGPNPMVFGWAGYHLWFLGFLFAYALLGIPVFLWLKRSAGERFVAWLARLSERRGGLLIFLIPLILVQLILRPWFPDEHHWADFFFTFIFFIAGYILYSDPRFEGAVRRDWPLMLTLGIISTLLFFAGAAAGVAIEWMSTPGIPQFYLGWTLFSVNSWCWTMFVLYLGRRYLDFTNKWLQYGQQMIMPFFLVHQPVILGIAFFVVQWDINLLLKLLIVVLGSFVISLGIYEVIFKRVGFLGRLFGMKASSQRKPPAVAD
jgi:hypothetical protein